MATLVFSTVGTVLGGPIGGAIGALIGQSIDQELLAPKGPKLNELNVQTSSYGTQIPRIYGRMRIAGSVIWATDLVQGEQLAGAKGQSSAVTSYTVSFAVALSSRPIFGIGRIWADGKLLRGGDGQFKVATEFRFYDGGEAQDADPLIASVEGIDTCPAYRGLAIAVFENLELAEFGNRIPFLTFETLGEEGVDKVPLSAILADASNGSIEETGSDNVVGYAAYGANVRTAIAPIIDTFAVRMFDDGERIRSASAGLAAVAMDELGNSADQDREPRFRRELLPAGGLPSSLRLGFYDEARDFQSGEARAAVGETTGPEARREFPAVIPSDQAKQLAQEVIAREWAERDRMSLRLPKRFLAIEPGAVINVPLTPARWVISRVTIEGFVPVAELRPEWLPASSTLAADSGRLVAANDVAVTPVTIALFEVSQPASSGTASSPARFVAASSKSPVWRRRVVTILAGHSEIGLALAARKAVLGTALAALPDGQVAPVTEFDEVEIELIDPEQWLESRDETALAEGANLAMVGREVIQFASAIPLGAGRFRLGRLGRGKGATEQEMAGHVPGEPFVLLEPATLAEIELPPWLEGLPLRLRATPDSIPPIALHSGQSA